MVSVHKVNQYMEIVLANGCHQNGIFQFMTLSSPPQSIIHHTIWQVSVSNVLDFESLIHFEVKVNLSDYQKLSQIG